MSQIHRRTALAAAAAAIVLAATPALAQKKYDTGATDTTIKLGTSMPLSGPVSSFGVIGKGVDAYFKRLNEQGGINGRKVEIIIYDDEYSPPKAVEVTRKLVEQDQVLATFGVLGTGVNSATQKYLNAKGVPQLFIGTGATKWNDPKNFPWTVPFVTSYGAESEVLRAADPAVTPERQDRRPVPERRHGQGHAARPEGRPGCQGLDDCQ